MRQSVNSEYTEVNVVATTSNLSQIIVFDSNVIDFITTASITSIAINTYLNTFVTQLKNANLWTKFTAIYPFVGGTSFTHSLNLINPALYQITWYNTPTHSVSGVSFNGTNQYGVSSPSIYNRSNFTFSTYLRTTSSKYALDISDSNGNSYGYFRSTGGSGEIRATAYNMKTPVGQGTGFYTVGRVNDTTARYSRNGSVTDYSLTRTLNSAPQFYIGGGVLGTYSNRQTAFTSYGVSLSVDEHLTFYTILQEFQTNLGRQI